MWLSRLGFALISCLFLVAAAPSQPLHDWEYSSPADYPTSFYGACSARNGDYVLVGFAGAEDSSDIVVERISATGSHLWTTRVTGARFSGADSAKGVTELPNGELRVIATIDSGFTNYAAVVSMSASGEVLSTWRWGGSGSSVSCQSGIGTYDGNLVLTGYYRGENGSGDLDGFLLKKRADGDTLWIRRVVISNGGMRSVAELSGGGYMVAGHGWAAPNRTNHDFWLVKTDSTGVQQWIRNYGSNGHEYCMDVAVTSSGETFMAGYLRQGTTNSGYLLKVNTSGQELWSRVLSETGQSRVLYGISARPAGGCMAAGTIITGDVHQFWCVQRDPLGGAIGDWSWGASESSGLNGIFATNNGGWILCGQQTVNGTVRGYAMFLPAPDGIHGQLVARETNEPLGGVTITTTMGTPPSVSNAAGFYALELDPGVYDLVTSGRCVETDTTIGVTVLPDTTLVRDLQLGVPDYDRRFTSLNLVGQNDLETVTRVYFRNTGTGDLYVGFNAEHSSPNSVWFWPIPSYGTIHPDDSLAVDLHLRPDTSNSGTWEFSSTLVVHYNACPDSVDLIPVLVTVLDADEQPALPQEITMSPLYPNPFNNTAELELWLPHSQQVDLKIFDVTGRIAGIMYRGFMEAGAQRITFDGSKLSTGIYFVELRSGNTRLLEKAVLLK